MTATKFQRSSPFGLLLQTRQHKIQLFNKDLKPIWVLIEEKHGTFFKVETLEGILSFETKKSMIRRSKQLHNLL